MSNGSQYSDADVRAIIERAMTKGGDGSGLSHEDLLSIGEQVGLSRQAMEQGAQELAAERARNDARAAVVTNRRRFLALHAFLFALVNAVAFGINALTTPGEWWSLFSIVPWGFALALHLALVFGLPVSESAIARQVTRRAAKAPRLRIDAGASPASASASAGEEAVAVSDEASRSARQRS